MRRLLLLLVGTTLAVGARADEAGRPVLVLDAGGHTAMVRALLFTPDGRELVTASVDKCVRVWDVATGEPLRAIRPPAGAAHEGKLYAAALSPSGRTLAVAGYGRPAEGFGTISLIDYATGRLLRSLKGHRDVVDGLTYSPDGRLLASASDDFTVRLWDPTSGECVRVLRGHTARVYGVAFSADGARLVSGAYDRTGRIWDVDTGECRAVLKGHTGEVTSAAWSRDGRTIATGGWDRTVRLWDADGSPRKALGDLGDQVNWVAFSPDSRELLVTRGGDGGVFACSLYSVATGEETVRFGAHTNTVVAGAFSPDGRIVATAGGSANEVYLWDPRQRQVVRCLRGKGTVRWSAAWGPDGKTIAWGETGRYTGPNDRGPLERSFDLSELQLGGTPGPDFRRAQSKADGAALEQRARDAVAVTQDGSRVAVLKLQRDYDTVRSFSFLGTDRAVLGSSFGLYLYDAPGGALVREFAGLGGEVWAVAPSPHNRYLLSACTDQTLAVWNPRREEPLLTFFPAGDEWVAWTPEGYYACSPGGERLIGWQVNHGPDRMPDYYPAARFRKTLYRPDVIRELVYSGGTEGALRRAGVRGSAGERAEVGSVLPPRVRVTEPRRSTELPAAEVEVRATATSTGAHAVTALRLLVDGRPHGGQAGVRRFDAGGLGEVSASWSVTLAPGRHLLAAQADSAVSQGLSEPVEVTYVGGVASPPVELPRLYVLAVGIAEYPAGLKLDFAARDAADVAEAFRRYSKPLFRSVETRPLLDRDADRRAILSGLNWLRREVTQRDYAVVFFSGHGQRDEVGALYLLPADVDPDNLLATAVPAEQVRQALAGLPGKVVFLLDACHAGALDAPKRKASPLTDDLIRDLVTEESGVVAMCSSTGREFSVEDSKLRHGVFTQALVEGLSGKSAKSGDGAVYLHHLDAYITDRVKELTGGRQHPTTAKPSTVRSFPISRP